MINISTNDSFANKLKQLREKEGLSQTQLANKLNISRGSISYYENKERLPDIDVLLRICKYFNVSADYLIGLSDVASLDTDVQAVCQYTGLSEDSVKRLRIIYNGSPSLALKNEENIQIIDIVNKLLCDNDFSSIYLKLYLLSINSKNIVDVRYIEECMRNLCKGELSSIENIIRKITGKTDATFFEEMELNKDCDLQRYGIENLFSRIVDNFDNRIKVKQSIPTKELQELLEKESEDNNAKHPPKEE